MTERSRSVGPSDDDLVGPNHTSGWPWLPNLLFALGVLATCGFLLAMPVFPSQDGPLHLYYANAFRQLLLHRPGVYAQTYYIRNYLPPYASYYYGLIALGSVVSLETADKIIASLYVVLFAVGARMLLRTVVKGSAWAALSLLPVLLNWPLMMGFISYLLAVCLALLAIKLWCTEWQGRGFGRRGLFLLLLVLVALTHPIPWALVLGFAGLEIASRGLPLLGKPGGKGQLRRLAPDAVTLVLGCLPYAYIARFKGATQVPDTIDYAGHVTARDPTTLRYQLAQQWFELRHVRGLILFEGVGLPRLYRLGLQLMLIVLLASAVVGWLQRHDQRAAERRKEGSGRRSGPAPPGERLAGVWLLFSLLLGVGMLLIPNNFGGGYFFATRLEMVFYVSVAVAGSFALRQWRSVAAGVGIFAFALCLFTLWLGLRYIAPVAEEITTLRQIPAVADTGNGRPGLLLRAPGPSFPPYLSFNSFYWAQADYFRQHDLLLFNTPWLGDPIIPIRPRPGALTHLDASFYNENPQFRTRLMRNEAEAHELLGKVGFALSVQQASPAPVNPFTETLGDAGPGAFAAGWSCMYDVRNIWTLCRPSSR